MLVKFSQTWFSPTEVVKKDKIQSISGKRFRRGVQEVPSSLLKFLPSSAKIIKGEVEVEVVEEKTLQDFDQERSDADHVIEYLEKAEASVPKNKTSNKSTKK